MSPECQSAPNERSPNAQFSSPANDIWSLGIILINLTCGRNPWKRASPNDKTFYAYIHQPGFLQTILPITLQLEQILCNILNPDPKQRISLAQIRKAVIHCPRLTTYYSFLSYLSLSQPAVFYDDQNIIKSQDQLSTPRTSNDYYYSNKSKIHENIIFPPTPESPIFVLKSTPGNFDTKRKNELSKDNIQVF